MSDLTVIEKLRLEKGLDMSSGYVMNFSNKTFAEFVLDSVKLDIYDAKYNYESGSKANRMRAFWNEESNHIVGKLLGDIFESWDVLACHDQPPEPAEDCLHIVSRLKESALVPNLGVVRPNSADKGFEALAKLVQDSINRNEPEAGLDRLHTFLITYFRVLCKKHGISTKDEKPLHSLLGEYVKALKKEGLIESDMTEYILKSSISVMDAFNKVRNEQSFAHPNSILNYDESLLIFDHVTSSIRFIEVLESKNVVVEDEASEEYDDDIPF